MIKRFTIFILLFSFCNAFSQTLDISLKKEIEHSIVKGLKYLYDKQNNDGSWEHYPPITALVLSSFLRSHPNIGIQDSIILKGFNFLANFVKPDGGIYADDMKAYSTAICLMAYKDLNLMEHRQIIKNAESFLMGLQLDEVGGYSVDSIYFGGISYGEKDKAPDLSNLQWTIEALSEEEKPNDMDLDKKDEQHKTKRRLFFHNALKFLERTQNYKTNDQSYAENDGGFMYRPGDSKAGGTLSYGGMTYAGLKSYIYAGLTKDDERVKAAINWLKNNYTVEENPKMGNQGLYYYFQTMAKALSVYGEDNFVLTGGKNRNWRYDLADKLLKLQKPEGFWINENGRWWENNPILVTAYSIIALEQILKR
ncbi:MAG TPA: terpene cyclase/mutase family protein [Melioribacteraceae bacterium]|nr:terpene cyclase/mutase family protein [Melioribacteraceae bacterium]